MWQENQKLHQVTIGTGLFIFTLGFAALLSWSAYEIFISEMHIAPKVALFLLFTGLLIIFCTVLINRIKIKKSDPYKDVEL
jgi:hypothetical protein